MPYDEDLAARLRAALASETAVEERRMMGGLVFLKNGNMLGGVHRDGLLVRVGADAYGDALQEPHVGPMDIGGRSPKGFVVVDGEGVRTQGDLQRWVAVGLAFASSLPPKAGRRA
jgi:TfoX/Sxy family transcriptional regulator of competence genes